MLGTVNPVDSLGLMRLWILTSIIPNIILSIYPYTHKRGQLLHCTPSPSKKPVQKATTGQNTKNNWQWGTHPQQGIHLQYNTPITKTGNIEEDGA